MAAYPAWSPCQGGASVAHFGTSVSGQLLPPRLLDALARAGAGFREQCPRNDDVWLHARAVRAGVPVRQIAPAPIHFPFIPHTQAVALHLTNFSHDNDVQIAATYTAADVARIRAAAAQA